MGINYDPIARKVRDFPIEDQGETEINEFGLDEGENLPFQSYTYQLFIDPKNTDEPVLYTQTKKPDRFEIYIWKKIPDKFKRPMILHEIVESLSIEHWYYQKGGREPEIEVKRRAHNLAVELDNKFAKENLDDKAYSEYQDLRKKYGRFSDGNI